MPFYSILPYSLIAFIFSSLCQALRKMEESPTVLSDSEKYSKTVCLRSQFQLRLGITQLIILLQITSGVLAILNVVDHTKYMNCFIAFHGIQAFAITLSVSKLFTTVDGREANIVKDDEMLPVDVVQTQTPDGMKSAVSFPSTSRLGSRFGGSKLASTSKIARKSTQKENKPSLDTIQSKIEDQLVGADEEFNAPACPVRLEFAEETINWWKKGIPSFKEFFSFPNPVNDADHRIEVVIYSLIHLLDIAIINYYDNLAVHYTLMFILLMKRTSGPRLDPVSQITVRYIRPLFVERFITLILFYVHKKATMLIILWSWFVGDLIASMDNLCLACGSIWLAVKYKILPSDVCEDCMRKYKVTRQESVGQSASISASGGESNKFNTKHGVVKTGNKSADLSVLEVTSDIKHLYKV
jgi:hypothetical protein